MEWYDKYIEISKKNYGALHRNYRIPTDELYSETLLMVVENKQKYDKCLEEFDEEMLRKKMYGHLRGRLCVYRKIPIEKKVNGESVKDIKRVWFYPDSYYIDPVEVDQMIDSEDGTEVLKELFYEHIDCFKLDEDEELFIDMCFSGLHPNYDIKSFKEAFPNKSREYIKRGYYGGVIKKVKANSPFNRSR